MKENDIQKEIINFLKTIFPIVLRNNSGQAKKGSHIIRFGLKGSSDIIGMTKNGKFFAIEVKKEKGKLTDSQNEFIKLVNGFGGIAIVAYSLKDVIDTFKIENRMN